MVVDMQELRFLRGDVSRVEMTSTKVSYWKYLLFISGGRDSNTSRFERRVALYMSYVAVAFSG